MMGKVGRNLGAIVTLVGGGVRLLIYREIYTGFKVVQTNRKIQPRARTVIYYLYNLDITSNI
jgi:hypothetical protein